MATVLVIEDDPVILSNTVELLELEGFEVLSASDGSEGIQQAHAHVPDVIICDILMPKVDGHGVLSSVRANPATNAIPLVFVSAIPREDLPASTVRLGISDYLVKPFRAGDLIRVIRRLLNNKTTS